MPICKYLAHYHKRRKIPVEHKRVLSMMFHVPLGILGLIIEKNDEKYTIKV